MVVMLPDMTESSPTSPPASSPTPSPSSTPTVPPFTFVEARDQDGRLTSLDIAGVRVYGPGKVAYEELPAWLREIVDDLPSAGAPILDDPSSPPSSSAAPSPTPPSSPPPSPTPPSSPPPSPSDPED
jgi:hypothetical protein